MCVSCVHNVKGGSVRVGVCNMTSAMSLDDKDEAMQIVFDALIVCLRMCVRTPRLHKSGKEGYVCKQVKSLLLIRAND